MTTDHPTRIGDYDVLGKLGKGGMGSVFKAVQPSLNRIVAIKVLDDELAMTRRAASASGARPRPSHW